MKKMLGSRLVQENLNIDDICKKCSYTNYNLKGLVFYSFKSSFFL